LRQAHRRNLRLQGGGAAAEKSVSEILHKKHTEQFNCEEKIQMDLFDKARYDAKRNE
jgi:hypothetical protein